MLIVIPAKGDSSGLKEKNLQLLGGKTLVQHAVEFSRALCLQCVVTTDSQKVADSLPLGCQFIISNVHGPSTLAVDVWSDALVKTEYQGDYAAYLEPTSPLRTRHDFESCVKALEDKWYRAAATVSKAPYIDKLFHIDAIEQYRVCAPSSPDSLKNRPRQKLRETFQRNGAVYMAKTIHVLGGMMMDCRCYPVISDGPRPNIDSQDDLDYAEYLWERRSKSL